MSKTTWRFWIMSTDRGGEGCYYNFKSSKIYWAYRWWVAKCMDERGFGLQTKEDPTGTKNTAYTRYRDKYE